MFYKIASVDPLPDYILHVVFQNGDIRYFDVSRLFQKWEAFRALREMPELFSSVRVDAGGYGVSWNDALDIECNDLWEFGSPSLKEQGIHV